MNILSIGGSNSKNSINRQLAMYAAGFFEKAAIKSVDISQMRIPIFSIDEEKQRGIPPEVYQFLKEIDEADLIVLSLAENNGSYNTGFKNLLDWSSRVKDRELFNGKPMLLMAASPNSRGGSLVLENAKLVFPFLGATIIETFSVPNFYQNYDYEKGITNSDLLNGLKSIVSKIKNNFIREVSANA